MEPSAALELVEQLVTNTLRVVAKVRAALAENRQLTPAEVKEFADASDESRARAQALLDASGNG